MPLKKRVKRKVVKKRRVTTTKSKINQKQKQQQTVNVRVSQGGSGASSRSPAHIPYPVYQQQQPLLHDGALVSAINNIVQSTREMQGYRLGGQPYLNRLEAIERRIMQERNQDPGTYETKEELDEGIGLHTPIRRSLQPAAEDSSSSDDELIITPIQRPPRHVLSAPPIHATKVLPPDPLERRPTENDKDYRTRIKTTYENITGEKAGRRYTRTLVDKLRAREGR